MPLDVSIVALGTLKWPSPAAFGVALPAFLFSGGWNLNCELIISRPPVAVHVLFYFLLVTS